jgi:uncharacterized protein with GYD domain
MALYMARFSYTSDTWAALIRSPEDREATVRSILERQSCKLHNLWYAFGEDDGYAVIEAPDNVTAAGVVLAITSSGAFTSFKTSVLMTQQDALEAMRMAAEVSYTAPGAGVHA